MRKLINLLILCIIFLLIGLSYGAFRAPAEESDFPWVVDGSLIEEPLPEETSEEKTYLDENYLDIEDEALRRLSSVQKVTSATSKSSAPSGILGSFKEAFQRETVEEFFEQPDEFVAEIFMNQELWAKQPNVSFEIPFGETILLQGQGIKRFLVLNEGFVRVDQQDANALYLTSTRRGSVLMHVWDERGRWTFNIVGVLPPPTILNSDFKPQGEWVKHNDTWKFTYSNNWSTYYLGDSVKQLDRSNLNFVQILSMEGPTPYGLVYGSINSFKFDQSTEIVGQSLGLVDGKIGPLHDFSVYGFDTSKRFSELSLPGRYFRGVRWDQDLFDRKLAYSFIYGQDRSNFNVISPGVSERSNSYITGAKATLFPDSENNYSINFIRGFGSARPDDLPPKVWSGEMSRRIGDWQMESELAYDQNDWAMFSNFGYEDKENEWDISFRNYEDDFSTITNYPGERAEIGGTASYEWTPENSKQRFFSSLDIYRDRRLYNPEHRDRLNYDLATDYNYTFDQSLIYNLGVFYTDTQQLISPRQDLRINSTFSKSFRSFYNREISTFFTTSFQRSRFEFTPSAEYDRTSLYSGIGIPLIENLNIFLNYNFSYVEAIETGEKSRPRVLNTGLSYGLNLGDKVSTRTSISWRDEQEADKPFSFLSGTDTLRGNLSVTYRPKNDVEIFFDGTLRNVLSEKDSNASFNDAEIRLGLRTTWDTMFSWDPSGEIVGYVYKDLNQNNYYDEEEPGIENVIVRVGDQKIKTNMYGRYYAKVRAKQVKVAVDLKSLPEGFNVTTNIDKEVVINTKKLHLVDFGLFSRTSIYGVVFEDVNGNGRLDSGEMRIPRVGIKLDGQTKVTSDFEGIYQFNDISEGAHTFTIDIRSIPLEYLPNIKLKQNITLKEGERFNLNIPLRKK